MATATGVWAAQILDLCRLHLREADRVSESGGVYTFTFTPDLSPTELLVFEDIVASAKSETGLSVTDYAAVRAQMQVLRGVRQAGRNAYVNMTEGDRNRLQYDVDVAILEIFLKLFRDT